MKLTHANYYTDKNRFLSNSKINDWLLDENYFYRRHVTHEVLAPEKTDAMIIGDACDIWLTKGGVEAVLEKYIIVLKKTAKTKDIEHRVSASQFKDIETMCRKVEQSPAYRELQDGHITQEVLYFERPLGKHFLGLCGIPDWYKVDGDTCIITDLKTAASTDPVKHHWHCQDFGYYRQMAMYSILLKEKYPHIKQFKYRHLVIQKDPQKIFNAKTFTLSNERVEQEIEQLEKVTLPAIAAETQFAPKLPDWDEAITIGRPYEATE